MMNKNVKNALLMSRGATGGIENIPKQYAGRGRHYPVDAGTAYLKEYGKYATNAVPGMAQGLLPDDPERWVDVEVRLADILHPTATMTRTIDNYQEILVLNKGIEYIPFGTKFAVMGSTWICIDPQNISGGGIGTVEKCNTKWRHLDFYGNVLEEPVAIAIARMSSNASDFQMDSLIAKGYFQMRCQYNSQTAQLDTNSRMVLGTGCYKITGYSDWNQEFTSKDDSVRILEFTIRVDEPNPELDDLDRKIAGGKTFRWDIVVRGVPKAKVGWEGKFTAESIRNGVVLSGNEEGGHTVTHLWTSSDDEVVRIEADGQAYAVGEGECEITCTLAENPDISTSYKVEVTENGDTGLYFSCEPPEQMMAYETTEIEVIGNEDAEFTWSFSGASKENYSVIVDDKRIILSCWGGDPTPLEVTVTDGSNTISTEITLMGL